MALATRSNSGSAALQFLLAAALAFLVPVAAHANGCSFSQNDCVAITNFDGTAGGGLGGLTLGSSTVTGIKGSSLPSGDHATLSFTTGSFISGSGSLAAGGQFNGGGLIKITGTYGDIHGGTIFSGVFSGPVSWVFTGITNGVYNYTLTGAIMGTWDVNGHYSTSGSIVQIDFTSAAPYTGKAGQLTDTGGVTQLFGLPPGAVVPEPSSLSLLGTGLLGLGFAVRRKVKGTQDKG